MARARRRSPRRGGRKWIAGSVKRPGALTRKARSAGMSTRAYARAHRHSKGLTGRQARWAINVHRW